MRQQRIIFHLADGRKIYATHHGEIIKWSAADIRVLTANREQYGSGAYLSDLSRYGVVAEDLQRRFPKARIVKVVEFEAEDYSKPLRKEVIY